MSKRTLEKYRIFPYIAWGLIISFAFFVYHLSVSLADNVTGYSETRLKLEEKARTNPLDIVDFDR